MLTSIALSLAKRFGISATLVEFLATFALLMMFALAAMWAHHHIYHQGEMAADARHAVIDRANSDRADKEKAKLDQQIGKAQADLDAARLIVLNLKKENDHEKATSLDYQRRLAAGDERLRVLTRVRSADPAGTPQGPSLGRLDQEPSVIADLDPTVASNLVGLTSEGDSAILRLNACIIQYDALKTAVDAMP